MTAAKSGSARKSSPDKAVKQGVSASAPQEGPRRGDIPGPVLLKDLARNAWRLYRSHLIGIFFICAMVQFGIVTAAVAALSTVEVPTGSLALLAYFLLFIGVPALLYGYAMATAAIFLCDRIAGVETTVVGALRSAGGKAGAIILGAAVAGILASFSLFVVGPELGQFITLPFFIGPPIVIQLIALERLSAGRAWDRAKQLLKGEWTRIPLYLLTIAMGLGLLDFVVVGAVLSSFHGVDSTGSRIAIAAAELVGASLTLPYLGAGGLIGYFDLRARKEQFDKQTLVSERAAR
ncbi:MAG: hypothetical protein M3290_03850 [Actinomycetota bacterium]|nr:hypothetical protein [Actinomycetota bacterium]